MANVLIAEDEDNLRKVLCALLRRDGHRTFPVNNGRAALDVIAEQSIDIVITDLRMPQIDGLTLLRTIKEQDSTLPVIVITAHGSVDTAVNALKNGAFDYITKPFDKEELKLAVRKAEGVHQANQGWLRHGEAPGRFRITGQSEAMQDVYRIIEKVAATPSTVLITGESGTGKELVATALHENSTRHDAPFIKVNCAAIPKDLLESEFFGYEQGAFTGAVAAKPGRFELADGGTLFLDEIAEIPVAMQVKLLRALQESEFERVGGIRTLKVDVRVIAATNRDLVDEIRAGNFREDLYYRLNVVPIALPPLRQRHEDIPLLAGAFLAKCCTRLNKPRKQLDASALETLSNYAWPGNIRELENLIERMVLLTDEETITAADLPEEMRSAQQDGAKSLETRPETRIVDLESQGSMKEIVRQATHELERDLITRALDETGGNVTRAAHLLGISRKGLQNKMKEFGLREPDNKS